MENIYSMVKSLTYAMTIALILTSCIFGGGNPNSSDPGSASTVTGLEWNVDEEDGGSFQVSEYAGQPVGPNLVFIEGGRAVLGSSEEDVVSSRDNVERSVTVASFYMDETEITNINWLEYEHYIRIDSEEVRAFSISDQMALLKKFTGKITCLIPRFGHETLLSTILMFHITTDILDLDFSLL